MPLESCPVFNAAVVWGRPDIYPNHLAVDGFLLAGIFRMDFPPMQSFIDTGPECKLESNTFWTHWNETRFLQVVDLPG